MGSKPKLISASRGAALLGLSEWESAWSAKVKLIEEVYPGYMEEKKISVDEMNELPAAMRWGLAFEDEIARKCEMLSGRKIGMREKAYEYNYMESTRNYITCHIDGKYTSEIYEPELSVLHNYKNTLHEAKTTNSRMFALKWGNDSPPIAYQIQCQHQMMCSGAKRVILSVLIFPKAPEEFEQLGVELDYIDKNVWTESLYQMGYFRQYVIEEDTAAQSAILKAYKTIWLDILEKNPGRPGSLKDVLRYFIEPKGEIIATKGVSALAAEYKSITKEEGEAKKRKENIKKIILDFMRKKDVAFEDEKREKTIVVDKSGNKLCQWNGKQFRS